MAEQYLAVRIESEQLPAGIVKVFELAGTEAISRPFEFRVHFYTEDGSDIDAQAMLGEQATLVFERAGQPLRRMHGMVSAIHDSALTGTGNAAYRATFVPRVWSLEQNFKTDVFLYLTAPEIIAEVLRRSGFEDERDFVFRLNVRYPRREFTVQYRETDLNFVSRLCEHFGIFFFWEHEDERDILVFADNNTFFKAVPEAPTVEWVERDTVMGVQAFEMVTRIVPTSYIVHDYNYRTPTVKLTTERAIDKTGGGGKIYDYGDHFDTLEEAALIARVRAEEVKCKRQNFEGRSNVPQLIPGAFFTMENHPRGDFALLLTEVHHAFSAGFAMTGGNDEGSISYTNDWSALPKAVSFRPSRVTPKPRVHGLLTAWVEDTTSDNPYAMLDESGRYRVRFLYDRANQPQGRASNPVRMSQPHVGPDYGMHFPIRHGREVVISCADGDPDRPVILGGVPNPLTASPTDNVNQFENRLRTGQGNELRMNDTVAAQRVILESPYMNTLVQLGAKEHPEFGYYSQTDGHETHVASKSQNHVTTSARDFVEHRGVYAMRNLVMTAGIALPGSTLGHQALRYDMFYDIVREVMVDATSTLESLEGRKLASLEAQREDAQVRRDGALEQVVELHPELSAEDEDEAPEEPAEDGGNAEAAGGDDDEQPQAATEDGDADPNTNVGQPTPSISDRIRQAREVELAALGMANGVVQEAHETISQFARRVDQLRRTPLFGQERRVAAALDRVSQTAQRAQRITGQATAAINQAQNVVRRVTGAAERVAERIEQVEDRLRDFRKPPRNPGESASAYRRRVAEHYARAAEALAWRNVYGDTPMPGADDMVEWHRDPRNLVPGGNSAAVGAALARQAEAPPSQRASFAADPPQHEERQESVKQYERAANQNDRVANRISEYHTSVRDRPPSLFRETAERLLRDMNERGESAWGWGDLGNAYSLLTDALQRARLGSLMEHAERVATTSAGRMPRESDEVLTHPDDTDGALIQSARKVAAVLGEDAVLASERATTVTSRGSVNIVGGANTYIHASSATELSSNSSVALTAHHHVDLQSDDNVSIVAHPRGATRGTDEESMPAYHNMLIRSRKSVLFDCVRGSIHMQALEPRPSESEPEDREKGNITIDAGHEILATAKKKIAVTSAEDDIILTTVKQKIRLHALEEAMQLTSKKDMTAATEAKMALSAKTGTTVDDAQTVTVTAPTINLRGKVYLG